MPGGMKHQGADPASNSAVAKSAGLAFIGRLGALLEVIGLPIFAALYGAPTLGIFFTLWSALRVITTLTEFSMTTTLQRFVPQSSNEDEAHQILKTAIALSLVLGLSLASILYFLADDIAKYVNASEADAPHLPEIIRFYVWVLPFWTMIEVLTSSVRARRKFGPEIRVRIFYEQGMRIIAGVSFFYLGFPTFGIFYAHFFSVAAASLLSLRLVSRFYSLKMILTIPFSARIAREMASFAVVMAPANLIKRLNSELPVILLNLLLPGATGASAVAIYGVGRRIASVLQVFRQSFEYVVAPFASYQNAKKGAAGRARLVEIYAFSTRMIMAMIIPFAVMLLAVRKDLMIVFASEFDAAASVLLVLAIGRVFEAFSGPAAAMVEMLGHRTLPLLNGLLGIAAMATLVVLLAPTMGAAGAAIGATVGLNVTAYASLAETIFVYDLMPYRKSLIRPFITTIVATLLSAGLIHLARELGEGARLAIAPISAFIVMWVLIRWGLEPHDADAFGRIGRWLRPKSVPTP